MRKKQHRKYVPDTRFIVMDRRIGIDYSRGVPEGLQLYVKDRTIVDYNNVPYNGISQFIVRDDLNLRLAKVFPAEVFYMPHPTLTKGGPVIGAGQADLVSGEVLEAIAESGHYRDKVNPVEYSINTLRTFWQAVEKNRIKISDFATSSLRYILFRG
ncbi:MAG: hypothetical protein AABW41_00240 [Nanoarchaeota archaeon]